MASEEGIRWLMDRAVFYKYRAMIKSTDDILPEYRGKLCTVEFVHGNIAEIKYDGNKKEEVSETLVENLIPLASLSREELKVVLEKNGEFI